MKAKIFIGIIIFTFAYNNIIAQDSDFKPSPSKIVPGEMSQQDPSKDLNKRFKFGVKLGLNMATIPTTLKIKTAFNETKNNTLSTKYIPSLYFGFLTEYTLNNKNFKIQAELLYSRNGSRHSENQYVIIDELLMPLVLKYDLSHNFNLPLNICGGVYTGYIFKAIGFEDYDDAPKYDITSQYTSFDSGMVIGVDYAITDNIIVDFRFNYGFLNISKASTATDQIEAELKSYNRFFHFGVNYMF